MYGPGQPGPAGGASKKITLKTMKIPPNFFPGASRRDFLVSGTHTSGISQDFPISGTHTYGIPRDFRFLVHTLMGFPGFSDFWYTHFQEGGRPEPAIIRINSARSAESFFFA